MIITVDTKQPLSKTDESVLRALLNQDWPAAPTADRDVAVEFAKELDTTVNGEPPVEEPAPERPKRRSRKAAAPKEDQAPAEEAQAASEAPAEAEPTPEPEPVPEPEPTPNAPELSDAVALATKLMSQDRGKEVKAVLEDLGVKRVSLLSEDQIEPFMEALSE